MFFTRCLHIAIVCSFGVPASAHAENVVHAAIKNATTPAHRMKSDEKNWWQERHESKAIEAKKKQVGYNFSRRLNHSQLGNCRKKNVEQILSKKESTQSRF